MYITLNPEIKHTLTTQKSMFDHFMQLKGHVYRELENRRTQRIILGNHSYFIKQHFGVGWKEIFKNLMQLRLPVLSAKNEWLAIQRLHQLNIPTLEIIGYGCRGQNPATRQSFIITRELPEFITLEDLCKEWKATPPAFGFKYRLIKEVARIANTLHTHGINHRDFYICHFLLALKDGLTLSLIDLHRAEIRNQTPKRWVIKDLAGLYFSSKDIGLTQRDIYRFIKLYRGQSLRKIFNKETPFWQKVKKRGDKLYQKHNTN